jgi:ribosome biogenesis GTPase
MTQAFSPRASYTLKELGFTGAVARAQELVEARDGLSGCLQARVSSVHSALLDVWTPQGPMLASMRSRARKDPALEGGVAVGDWVLLAPLVSDATEAVVEAVLPRRSVLLRQAAGEKQEAQAIAANVDVVLVTTALDGLFDDKLIERYLLAIREGGARPLIVLTKSDLVSDVAREEARERASELAPTVVISSKRGDGLTELGGWLVPGTTGTLVGMSGTGKSALINRLVGYCAQREGEVRAYDGKGRHTTTRRELFLLEQGGLLIDTPGMREFRPWVKGRPAALEEVFEDIVALGMKCHYRDCQHGSEPSCAVREAVASGLCARERFEAYRRWCDVGSKAPTSPVGRGRSGMRSAKTRRIR